jgi:organic radical activating enzyme
VSISVIDCFATTNSFQVDAQGKDSPCCKFKGNFADVTSYSSVSEIFADPKLIELKNQHENGNWTKACLRCQQDEHTGKQSRRMMYDVIGLSKTDYFIDVSLGNYCNLKCRMCGPENSTQWYADYEVLAKNNLATSEPYQSYLMDDATIEMIAEFISTVTGRVIVEVKGGEPLLMPNSEKFFTSLSNCANANNIEIWIATNGTRIPTWFESCISKFKTAEISVSVDGTNETYSYIRGTKHPYKDVIQNSIVINNMKNVMLRFNVVVQNLNIRNVAELYDDLYSIVGSHAKITLILLRFPIYYQINIYPDDKKDCIVRDMNDRSISQNSSYRAIVNLLMMPSDTNSWNMFRRVTGILDTRRAQDITGVDECLATLAVCQE